MSSVIIKIMDKKLIKKILKSSCRQALIDLIENVGFTDEETALFFERYINNHSKPIVCLKIHCGSTKFNYLHNNILSKIESYFLRIK